MQGDSRVISYGDGVFETLRVVAGQIPLLDYHMQRLQRAENLLGYGIDLDGLAEHLCLAAASPVAGIRLMVYRHGGSRGYAAKGAETQYELLPIESIPASVAQNIGIAQHRLPERSDNPGLKSCSAIDYIIAANENDRWDDLLLFNASGHLVETTRANIIFSRGDELLTPSLERSGVRGVFREALLDANLGIKETVIDREMLASFDGALTVNALRGPQTVKAIATQNFLCDRAFKDVIDWAGDRGFY